MSARRWVEFLLPDALSMHFDWLQDVTCGDQGLLTRVAQSPTARRLLNRTARRRHGIAVPARVDLAPHQQWLLLPHADQAALARRLGLDALRDYIRTAVRAPAVAALRRELGEEGYTAALTGTALPVRGLDRTRFDAALERGGFAEYVVAVGAALLETTTATGDPFCRLRMRFAFSPACWRTRPRTIEVDAQELARRICEPADR
jgi:hypothetical protein